MAFGRSNGKMKLKSLLVISIAIISSNCYAQVQYSATHPDVNLSLGTVPGMSVGTKFGRNSDIDRDTDPQDVWEGGGTYTGQPLSFTPETVDVRSSSAADASAGTGARTIRIMGLKTSSSTSYESEDITLNGTTDVTSSATWWRVNRVYVLTAGTGGGNAGVITIEASTTSANVFAKMPAGYNQTQIAAYTVPASQTMIVKRIRMSITRNNGSAGSATATIRARPSGGVYQASRVFELQTGGGVDYTSYGGKVFTAGTDLKLRIEQVSDDNTIVDGAFEFILVEN